MKEKLTIVLGIGITALVVITLAFYAFAKNSIELFDIIKMTFREFTHAPRI